MADFGGDWCLIESDPGVFTQLITRFGAVGVQVEEIWSMEDEIFDQLRTKETASHDTGLFLVWDPGLTYYSILDFDRPVHGLIFLFKYVPNEPPMGTVIEDKAFLERIYFARQVINNACATQAVISILLNCDHPDLELGPELTQLKEFSRTFDPKMRGLAFSNSETIRSAHNAMSHQHHMFEVETLVPGSEDDAYHYVSYIPFEGRIYELDGLRNGPIDHGPYGPEKDWVDVVRPIIVDRIELYTKGEINFNLMALVSDRRTIYDRQLNEVLTSTEMLGVQNHGFDAEVTRLRMLIDYEDVKMAKYATEMARRRHNYLPFIITLLQILAEQRKLSPLLVQSPEQRAAKRMKT